MQHTIPDTVDASRCPLCGGDNRCAMEIERSTGLAQGPCWCVTASFDATLLTRLPEQSQGTACICANCAAAAPARPQD